MGRNIPRQHFLALSVIFLGGFKQLQLLDYCIYVNKVKFPRIFGWTPWSGCLQTRKILPGNLCRKGMKFPEIPGNLYFQNTSEKWLKSGKIEKIRPLLP